MFGYRDREEKETILHQQNSDLRTKSHLNVYYCHDIQLLSGMDVGSRSHFVKRPEQVQWKYKDAKPKKSLRVYKHFLLPVNQLYTKV